MRLTFQRPDGVLFEAGYALTHQGDRLEGDLHPEERTQYDQMRFEKRKTSYLLGRSAAKRAVSALTGITDLPAIRIEKGIFHQPIVSHQDLQNVQVSLTHAGPFGAAVAYPEHHPLGLDLERISSAFHDTLQSQLTEGERERLARLPLPVETGLTMMWTAKEALSKILKTGLMTPFRLFEITDLKRSVSETGTVTISGDYEHFAQYKFHAYVHGDWVCALALPRRSELLTPPTLLDRLQDRDL